MNVLGVLGVVGVARSPGTHISVLLSSPFPTTQDEEADESWDDDLEEEDTSATDGKWSWGIGHVLGGGGGRFSVPLCVWMGVLVGLLGSAARISRFSSFLTILPFTKQTMRRLQLTTVRTRELCVCVLCVLCVSKEWCGGLLGLLVGRG